jgi:hypothetical protein
MGSFPVGTFDGVCFGGRIHACEGEMKSSKSAKTIAPEKLIFAIFGGNG